MEDNFFIGLHIIILIFNKDCGNVSVLHEKKLDLRGYCDWCSSGDDCAQMSE